LKAEVFRI